ncbi:nitroreductase family protein [Frateuria terrea]|uniref:Putative NAD(P)H nitroreductase n=1 Tax=Frateuria terrea TaxID=529704 RepID=A0A1H6VY57_9GAMM|nr:nitroreductase [Frateuria terrea]SEJ09611.1 Nitroreductase [Frateuria terrea]SFP68284.1 Nitroreductase [Frateuria terrea]
MPPALDLLMQRHSTPSRQLGAPGPEGAELHALLEAAVRVPDHGKLVPFRLIELRGDAKQIFGDRLAAIAARNPALSEAKREKERTRYGFAPLVLVVVARVTTDSKVPPIEQEIAAGCVAYNLLLGAHALGYGAQWLTGWAAYDAEVAALLRLAGNERVIGFVHIGTPQIEVPDRDRPTVQEVFSPWMP